MRIVVIVLAVFLLLFGLGLFVEIPLLSAAANALAWLLKWAGIVILVLYVMGRRSWPLRILTLVFLVALATGLLIEVPYLSPVAHFVGTYAGLVLKWLSVLAFVVVLITFVAMEMIRASRRAKDAERSPNKKKDSPTPAKAAGKKGSWKENIPWLQIGIGLVCIFFVWKIYGWMKEGNASHAAAPVPATRSEPSTTPSGARYLSQAELCGPSKQEALVVTIAPGALSPVFENASDEQVVHFTPRRKTKKVELYELGQKHKCGPNTAGTERWCVKNISEEPVDFRCWLEPK